MRLPTFCSILLLAASTVAYDDLLRFNASPQLETRSIDQIYKTTLREGGVVIAWMGGDEKNQQDVVKTAFEKAFPGMKLNLTVDLYKYHERNIDEQLANGRVCVDTLGLRTLQDFPRWKEEGALLNYFPLGFDKIYPGFRDTDATYHGFLGFGWQPILNTDKLKGKAPQEYPDFLRPGFREKLVLTYLNDDDAILFDFGLILKKYGTSWFNKLLQQKPRWVRGSATGPALVADPNTTYVAIFTSGLGLSKPQGPLNVTFPKQSQFVS
ncbi:Hypothetical protein NCS54_01398500 [Fusarium falciforme]|uniref:Hypothetical protein n=1 Tax=Fusarium falciforme TaxID=195108 RepID=UPI002301D19B|nr:Hypothetical protein NCS54_01398500 [Fusarium falciforme]WAO96316.1 Hypothetical protein NCS54_01398500 [Fusarium falciforme]